MTGIQLEVDSDIHLSIKKGMREAISYITKMFSKANDKYM